MSRVDALLLFLLALASGCTEARRPPPRALDGGPDYAAKLREASDEAIRQCGGDASTPPALFFEGHIFVQAGTPPSLEAGSVLSDKHPYPHLIMGADDGERAPTLWLRERPFRTPLVLLGGVLVAGPDVHLSCVICRGGRLVPYGVTEKHAVAIHHTFCTGAALGLLNPSSGSLP